MAALNAYPALAELTGKDFLSSADISSEQTIQLLELAGDLKASRLSVDVGGKVLGLIFSKASTRTRVSFSVAMARLPLSAADAYALLRNSLESSFAPAAEKARDLDRLDEVFA